MFSDNMVLQMLPSLELHLTPGAWVGSDFEVDCGHMSAQLVNVREFMGADLASLLQVGVDDLLVESQSSMGEEA